MAKAKSNDKEKLNQQETEAENAGLDVQQETEDAQEESAQSSKEQELTEQLNELNDRLLRQAAEYDNFKKRSAKEKTEVYKDATAKCVAELLPFVDNLERALECECSDETFKKGVEMTYQSLEAGFDKLGVSEIEALGKPFDPNLHNAVSQISDDSFGENTVSSVFQKGYTIGDKVIRHAMVVVANP